MKRQHKENGVVRKFCISFAVLRTFELVIGRHRRKAKHKKAEMEMKKEEQSKGKMAVR